MAIVDASGNPISTGKLSEPQTAGITYLKNSWSNVNASASASPAYLATLLSQATYGNLRAQAEFFESMLERDAHMSAELDKRKNAPVSLNFTVEPPRGASFQEKKLAAYADEVLHDISDFDNVILSLMDGVGHGFSALEITWNKDGAELIPSFVHQPQEFFVMSEDKKQINLNDGSLHGIPLTPGGWVMHVHGMSKTGYLGRLALFRVLSWPFLLKNYAIGDFAEFLEIYGLPIIVGKYGFGASVDQQKSLLDAVTALGHDARAIMPADMLIEISQVTGGGSSPTHLAMVDWADKSMSKAILGGTLTSQADGKSSTNALGNVHNDVRDEIRDGDCKKIALSITRDIIYPLLQFNKPGVTNFRRCPRLVFDTGDAADLSLYADALPKLVSIGLKIPARYAYDNLRIPMPDDGEDILSVSSPQAMPAPTPANATAKTAAMAILSEAAAIDHDPTPGNAYTQQLAEETAGKLNNWLGDISALVQKADSLAALQNDLLQHYAHLDNKDLVEIMAMAFAAAKLSGLYDIEQGG